MHIFSRTEKEINSARCLHPVRRLMHIPSNSFIISVFSHRNKINTLNDYHVHWRRKVVVQLPRGWGGELMS